MRPFLATLALALLLFVAQAPAAHAAADIQTLTCRELLRMPEEEIGIILVWVDGYYSGVYGSTTFDPDSWEQLGNLVGTICGKNPKRRVLDALDDVMDAIEGQ
ncbi:HdeA/HdeB family chaperone [Megalodesulfovibrio paquesii]